MKKISLSLFKGYADVMPTEVSLQQIVSLIQNDASVSEYTEKHRYYIRQGLTVAAARAKADCPCFAVAVRFKDGKRQKNICEWTGLSLADIDHVPAGQMAALIQRICADEHTLLAYRTISGQGIRILFKADYVTPSLRQNLKLYARVFEEANRYYTELLHCECDLKCKNVTRLSGLAHDPEVFFNARATAFHITTVDTPTAPPRKDLSDKYLERAINISSEELNRTGITYTEHSHNEYIMRMGYLLNLYGVSQEAATRWATDRFTDYDGNISAIFQSCYLNTEEHGTRKLPRQREQTRSSSAADSFATVEEIESFLDTQATFRHNTITGKYEFLKKEADEEDTSYAEINDRLVNSLWCRMSKDVKPVRINDLRNVLESEYVPPFNPFTDYFGQLKPWDETTDHIDRLAATVHTTGDPEVFAQCFKKWLVGVVASLFDRQVVNHEILVLTGPQGGYKTTWLNALLPKCLQRYFYVKSNNNRITKDDMFTLTEFAIICLEEIDEMRPSEMNQLKAMVTMKTVNERGAYAHYKDNRPHIASFCGTSNNTHFLSDPTGSRRWLPFEVEHIDDPFARTVPHDAIYAQAHALWKSGFRYWFNAEEIRTVNDRNTHFEVPNMEQELVLTYYRQPLPGEECLFMSTTQILAHINANVRQPLSPTRIGIAMKQAGFKLVRTANQRGYRVVEYSYEEVHRNQGAMARYTAPADTPAEIPGQPESEDLCLDF